MNRNKLIKSLLLPVIVLATVAITAASTVALTAPAPPQTRIDIDQAGDAVRIIVGGREAARFDKDGLHVRRNVEYGGGITDLGSETAYKGAASKP